jgi:hypothetical protein
MNKQSCMSTTSEEVAKQAAGIAPESEDDHVPNFQEIMEHVDALTKESLKCREFGRAALMQKHVQRIGELRDDLQEIESLRASATGRGYEALCNEAKALRLERNKLYAEVLDLPKVPSAAGIPRGILAPTPRSASVPVASPPQRDELLPDIPFSELCSGQGPLPLLGNLSEVRVLSISKMSVAGEKGGSKGKGKGPKGKDKGPKGKGKGNEDGQILYVGKDGDVAAVMWYGAASHPLFSDTLVGALCNISKVRMRPGQLGAVFANSQTGIKTCLEPNDTPSAFPYRTSEFSDRFTTWKMATDGQLGSYWDVVVHVWQAEQKYTQATQEPYMQVSGKDLDGTLVGPLRLWRRTESDIESGSTYVLRGLKVAPATMWSNDKWDYVPNPDGSKVPECSPRTAIEDVSGVSDIQACF